MNGGGDIHSVEVVNPGKPLLKGQCRPVDEDWLFRQCQVTFARLEVLFLHHQIQFRLPVDVRVVLFNYGFEKSVVDSVKKVGFFSQLLKPIFV